MTPQAFLERLLQLLAQGGFSATYKYAVLLALIDLCVEAGSPPNMVTTVQIARRVVALYWPQVERFHLRGIAEGAPVDMGVLKQNNRGQAEIATLVRQFKDSTPDRPGVPRAGPFAPPGFDRLVHDVEWKLVEMPLPKLQRVGRDNDPFLYQIAWTDTITRRDFNAPTFDNRVMFIHRAEESLVALSSVLRPLIQQHWLAKVLALNGLPDADLDAFLFGADRTRLTPLQKPLRTLQNGRCFYCGDALATTSQVDHFLPWSRYPEDGLDNLVLAHESCNGNKLDFLADLDFGQRWEERSRQRTEALDEIAQANSWERDRARTFGVVASTYRNVPEGIRLWSGRERFRPLAVRDLRAVHAFGAGLLAP